MRLESRLIPATDERRARDHVGTVDVSKVDGVAAMTSRKRSRSLGPEADPGRTYAISRTPTRIFPTSFTSRAGAQATF